MWLRCSVSSLFIAAAMAGSWRQWPGVIVSITTGPWVVTWYCTTEAPACMMLLPARDMHIDTPAPAL